MNIGDVLQRRDIWALTRPVGGLPQAIVALEYATTAFPLGVGTR